jgi:signal transduction histidine kinase
MNTRNTNRTGIKENYLKIVTDFSMALIRPTSLEEVVWEIAKNVSLTLGFYDCVVYLYDEKKKELVQKAAYGPKTKQPFGIKKPITLPLGVGIVGSVAESMVAEIVNDTSKDPRYIKDDEFRYSEITVPIVFEDKLVGIIDSEHPEKDYYTQDQLEILQTIASMSATKIIQAIVFDHLQVQKEHLKLTNDRLLQFAYIATHDLRSPVSNINSLLSFFDTSKIDGENLFFLEKIKQASEKLQNNLNHLIELISDENKFYKSAETVVFPLLLEEVKQSVSKLLESSETKITAEFKIDSIEYPSVYLNSILLNLITNAIKYSVPGRSPVIEVKTEKVGKFTCLSVNDNGRGIDLSKYRHKIFSRLERFDRDVEGKGLGLYIIKNEVEALGGKIEVDSEIGIGTTFTVFLNNNWKELV